MRLIKQSNMKSEGTTFVGNQRSISEDQNVQICSFFSELSMFPMQVADNDDPFNLNNFNIPRKTQQVGRHFCASIEEQLKMLTGGKEQDLIREYEKKFEKRLDNIQDLNTGTVIPKKQAYTGESKNIPKNVGKQIIKFVKKNEKVIVRLLRQTGSTIKYSELKSDLEKRKKKMSKIGDLRCLWTNQNPYEKEMRTISLFFLRHHSLSWVFNSRVKEYGFHLKYRRVLLRFLEKPNEFVQLKLDI